MKATSRTELPIIKDGLILKPLREEDLVLFEKSEKDAEFQRGVGGDANSEPRTLKERREAFQKHNKDPYRKDFAIWTNNGELVGRCFLHHIKPKDKRASLAVGIHDKNFRGQGLGTKATKLLLEYAFETLRLHRVDLRVLEYNQAAIKCYKKCGFKEEGRERESGFIDGKYYDDIRMSILEQERREK